jgi:hypothetical protein
MSPITHFFIGWTIAGAAPSLTKRDRAFVTWASVVPDLDGLGIIPEKLTQNSAHPLNWWSDYHHVLGHNIGFALVVVVVAAMFANQTIKTTLLVWLQLSYAFTRRFGWGSRSGRRSMADPLFASFFEPVAFDLGRAMDVECMAQYGINSCSDFNGRLHGAPAQLFAAGIVFPQTRHDLHPGFAAPFSFKNVGVTFHQAMDCG